jgi:hypothetical protein
MTRTGCALLVIVVAFVSGWRPLSGDESATPFKTARKAAQKDARTPEGRDWEHRHASWLGPALTPIMKQCREQTPGGEAKDFAVYVHLSKAGPAHEAVVEPVNPFTRCFTNGVKELQYPEVPRENYWLEIKMHMRK